MQTRFRRRYRNAGEDPAGQFGNRIGHLVPAPKDCSVADSRYRTLSTRNRARRQIRFPFGLRIFASRCAQCGMNIELVQSTMRVLS